MHTILIDEKFEHKLVWTNFLCSDTHTKELPCTVLLLYLYVENLKNHMYPWKDDIYFAFMNKSKKIYVKKNNLLCNNFHIILNLSHLENEFISFNKIAKYI